MSPTNHFGNNEIRPWTLAEIYADLGSKQDISRTLNVNPHRVDAWIKFRARCHCPLPVRHISHIDVYSMQEWRDWFKRWEESHPNHKSFENPKVHGSGESFWKYFNIDD